MFLNRHVNIVENPYKSENLYAEYSKEIREIMLKAYKCQYCEHPPCMKETALDIRGMMRRVTVGNFGGARKLAEGFLSPDEAKLQELSGCQLRCIQNKKIGTPVEIITIVNFLEGVRS